jgi:hypothetical protein
MLKPFTVLFLLVAASGGAHAQAFGSVHCKASLRQIEIDLKAAEHKLQSVANGTANEKCSAMNVRALTLEHAAVIYGRCTEGREREERQGQTEGSAAGLRDQIAKTCG